MSNPEHAPSAPPSPDRREWVVPASLGLATVLVVLFAAMPSGRNSTANADGGTGAGSPSAQAPAEPTPLEIEASHVLVMYRGSMRAPEGVTRSQAEARTRAGEVLRKARGGEDIAVLARVYSDEPGAGDRGGSLGRFGRGAMVPAFEQAAFALRVGQVSEIVETPFGYHIIKRTR